MDVDHRFAGNAHRIEHPVMVDHVGYGIFGHGLPFAREQGVLAWMEADPEAVPFYEFTDFLEQSAEIGKIIPSHIRMSCKRHYSGGKPVNFDAGSNIEMEGPSGVFEI